MAARATMATLIAEVRKLGNAGTADHSVAGVDYWTDDQLQNILDDYRETHKRVALNSEPEYIDGDYQYLEYPIPKPLKWFEEAGAGGGWALRDGDGVAVAASYTVNYEAGIITFDADQDAEIYYLDARTYDVNRAAAEVWESKAGFYEAAVDWSSDNHSVKNSQQAEAARKMAAKFRSLAGLNFARLRRVDENPMYRRR